MNSQYTNNTSKLVLSVGDESGIGPEIILKALHSKEIPKKYWLNNSRFQKKSSEYI